MESFWNDVRYGSRILFKNPGFTLTAILTLALGIGANSAIFSVFTTVLLKPLPYENPERLVWLANTNPALGVNQTFLNPDDILDLREQAQSFDQVASWGTYPVNLSGGKEPERVESIYVTTNFFRTLGVAPLLGRDFAPDKGEEGSNVIISYGLWQRQFGGDPEIIGRKIVLAGNVREPGIIVGVLPAGLIFPPRVDLFDTYELEHDPRRGGTHNDRTIARLKEGVTLEQARAEVSALSRCQAEQYPDTNKGWAITLVPFREHLFGSANVALPLLFGAVALVLLLAWTNVIGLQLARAITRQKEIAIRLVLGTGRWRLVRQMLIESLLLSACGGGLGLLLARWGIEAVRALGSESLPRLKDATIDVPVLAFTAALSVLTGILFGLIPALKSSKLDLNRTLKESGGNGASSHRLRSLLTVMQFATATVLLVGTGLLLKSFWQLQQTSPGFQPEQVLAAGVSLNMEEFRDTAKRRYVFQQMLERVENLPGVEAAAATSHLPFGGRTLQQNFRVEGQDLAANQNQSLADYRVVTPAFFDTLQIPLKQGRSFSERDTNQTPIAFVVNEAFALTYFPGSRVVGQRIRLGYEGQWLGEVVGVVGDVKHRTMEAEAVPTIYASYLQCEPLPSFPIMNFVARAKGDRKQLTESMRRELQSVDARQVVFYVRPMTEFISDTTALRQFHMLLLGLFACVALSLAAVGIYGLMSNQVNERRHEIAIRLALGASRADVLRMVLSRGMRLAGLGLGVGSGVALLAVRLLQSLLYGVSATDGVTFISVALLLTGTALIACLVPSRNATKVNPMVTLRHQ